MLCYCIELIIIDKLFKNKVLANSKLAAFFYYLIS